MFLSSIKQAEARGCAPVPKCTHRGGVNRRGLAAVCPRQAVGVLHDGEKPGQSQSPRCINHFLIKLAGTYASGRFPYNITTQKLECDYVCVYIHIYI